MFEVWAEVWPMVASVFFLIGFLEFLLLIGGSDMKTPGRNQAIMVGGGTIILAAGFVAVAALPVESAKAFLDFAGPFGWKIIVGAITISGGIKIANILKNGKTL